MRTLNLALIVLGIVLCLGAGQAATCTEGPFLLEVNQGQDRVTVGWNKPAGLEGTDVELEISELSPILTRRGKIKVKGGATAWASSSRRALGTGLFDVKSPTQWTDAGVLTPGSEYSLRFKFISKDKASKNRVVHCVTTKVALTSSHEPKRPSLLGDARLATIGLAGLFLGLVILPGAFFLFTAAPALADTPRALRGDIEIKSALRRYAGDRSMKGFVRTLSFVGACLLLIKTRLPLILAAQIDPEDVGFLERALGILGRMSPQEWRLDHRNLLKEATGGKAAKPVKARSKKSAPP